MNTSLDSRKARSRTSHFSRSGMSRSGMAPGMESETIRLQKDVDTVTRKLEQERRRNATLDDKVKYAVRQVATRKTQLRKTLPTPKDEMQVQARIKVLENQLMKATVSLNKEQADGKKVRNEIDMYRREKLSYLNMFDQLKKEMIKQDKKASDSNHYTTGSTRVEDSIKREMLNLKARADMDQNDYKSQISMMQTEIDDDKKLQNAAIKDLAKLVPKGGTGESLDHVQLLKFMSEKWEEQVRDQKKALDAYNRNIRILHESFSQIRDATGISDIDEMVTSFIKAEEQNFTLESYLTQLNTDVDLLEDSNKKLREKVDLYKEMYYAEGEQSSTVVENLNREVQLYKDSALTKEDNLKLGRQQIAEMDSVLGEIVQAFGEFEFFNQIADKFDFEYEDQVLSENNVIERLSEIEEYINTLITAVSHKRERANPELAVIPVDALDQKEFEKAQDKPDLVDLVTMDEGDFDQPFTREDFMAKAASYIESKKLAEESN